MKAAVIYESMYGNTRAIAEAIAEGLGPVAESEVLSVDEAQDTDLRSVDLLVVGGPTHVHGMSRKPLRDAALKDAPEHSERGLHTEAAAGGKGLREWFDTMETGTGKAAAFDTRLDGPEFLTGHASKAIAKQLGRHGFELVAKPVSFVVGKDNHLLPGEQDRAREWGGILAAALSPTS